MNTAQKNSGKKPFLFVLLFALIVFVVAFGLFRQNKRIARENEVFQTLTGPQRTQQQQPPEAATDHDDHSHEGHSHDAESSSQGGAEFYIPPYYENPQTIALAATLKPETVEPKARDAYVVAQKKPQLLAQLPCFCYCDRFGHTSLHDCFVTDHAVHCDICMKEALQADQMDRQGMSGSEIRSIIVDGYRPGR